MEQAIRLGNRLIMMDKGRIILDVNEERKKSLTVERCSGNLSRLAVISCRMIVWFLGKHLARRRESF